MLTPQVALIDRLDRFQIGALLLVIDVDGDLTAAELASRASARLSRLRAFVYVHRYVAIERHLISHAAHIARVLRP